MKEPIKKIIEEMNKIREELKEVCRTNEFGSWWIRNYGDESIIHDQAVKDGFQVTDGRCDNPDCVLCSMENSCIKALELLSEYPEQLDTSDAQMSLLPPSIIDQPVRTLYYLGERI